MGRASLGKRGKIMHTQAARSFFPLNPLEPLVKALSIAIALLCSMLLAAIAQRHTAGATLSHEEQLAVILPCLFLLSLAAQTVGGLVRRRLGLSDTIGWILVGILLTNVPGIKDVVEHTLHDPRFHLHTALEMVSGVGVWFLLTEAGLETELPTLIQNAGRGTVIALIGVLVPGILIYIALPALYPELSPLGRTLVAAMFTPTSLGVAAIFFKSAGILSSRTAQLVMAVAAIDDIIGLLILTTLNGMSGGGQVRIADILLLLGKAIAFFAAALTSGHILAPRFSSFLAKLNDHEAMRLMLALFSASTFTFLAWAWGLSPLMGAYAGGVFLTSVHFKEFPRDTEEHGVEHLLRGVKYTLVPVFIASVAMKANISLFLHPKPMLLLLTGVGALVFGKWISARFGGRGIDAATLQWGALARGEVALVMANMGLASHLFSAEIMTVAVMSMVATILLASVFLGPAIKRAQTRDPGIFAPVGSVVHEHD